MIDENILLARGAIYKKINKGGIIFNEGTKCYYYHQLIEGKVNWVNYDHDGRVFIQYIVLPGECFGELPLFDEEPYVATAVAETDTLLLQLPKNTFHELLKERTSIANAFSRLLAQRVRQKFSALKTMASNTPEQQIVELFHLYKKKHPDIIYNETFKIDLTRQQIAEMTGLRVETVIRVIKKLEKKGGLYIDKGKVYLLNNDKNHIDIFG